MGKSAGRPPTPEDEQYRCRIQVLLRPDQLETLKQLASETGRPVSMLVREAVNQLLNQKGGQ